MIPSFASQGVKLLYCHGRPSAVVFALGGNTMVLAAEIRRGCP